MTLQQRYPPECGLNSMSYIFYINRRGEGESTPRPAGYLTDTELALTPPGTPAPPPAETSITHTQNQTEHKDHA